MTVRREGDGFNFDKAIKEFNKLNQYEVAVGFFGDRDAELLTIVRANEYGAHIQPKRGEYLYVPYIGDDNKKHFYKLKSVTIPARPFIRQAWMNNQKKYKRIITAGLDEILSGKTTAMKLLNKLGQESVADIRNSATNWFKTGSQNTHNAPLTIANKKGNDRPLVDTGELQRKVTYKIIRA